MSQDPLAGQPVPPERFPNIPRLVCNYFSLHPDLSDPTQRVSFGTSGHRGSSDDGAFTEDHILAITQATCEYRKAQGLTGPLLLGIDTHALSEAAFLTAVRVLIANGITTLVQQDRRPSPTPAISRAILAYNVTNRDQADGLILTPSHNPPRDGGMKYNPPNGGPADSDATTWIQDRANQILDDALKDVKCVPLATALSDDLLVETDFCAPYVDALSGVLDMEAIAGSGVKLGVDPLGGASIDFWDPIADRYGLDIEVVKRKIDASFGFMRLDRDGKIRMDCSSPWAMGGLIALKDRFDVAFGNDPDADRHGIVTKSSGLLNPNHYLSVAIDYLYRNRPDWPAHGQIGKTLVSSSMIDRVAAGLGRDVCEVPVGFKWFVPGLFSGEVPFGGEESAGASFLCKDGSPWSTDKDGILLCLLAAEITAVTGKDPGELYTDLTTKHGAPVYARSDAPADLVQKAKLKKLSAEDVKADSLAGEPITGKLTHAPGNGAAIGGLKVTTENGWFAARPSGTENIYKIYAESFKGETHLADIQSEAKELIDTVLKD